MAAAGRRVLIGRIVGLYGVQGWLKIESWAEPRMRIFDYQPWLLTAAPGVETQIAGAKGRTQGKGMVAQLPGLLGRPGPARHRRVRRALHAAPPPTPGVLSAVERTRRASRNSIGSCRGPVVS